jgi:hypothetical protein
LEAPGDRVLTRLVAAGRLALPRRIDKSGGPTWANRAVEETDQAVLLPVRTVGVMGDGRTYGHVCALRAVTASDGMTANFFSVRHGVPGEGRRADRHWND